MKDANHDKLMKDMLLKTRSKLDDPDFNSMMMHKIILEGSKRPAYIFNEKLIMKKLLLYFLVTMNISFFIFLLVMPIQPYLSGFKLRLSTLPQAINNVAGWIVENCYFLIPFVLLLLINRIALRVKH